MLIDIETEGVMAASAASAGLAAETLGHTGQAAAAGTVVPPGADPDVSPVNVARITAHTAHVASMLAASGALQELYAISNGVSAGMYDLTDALNAVGLNIL